MAIVGPIAPESNPPLNPQYYLPQRFNISDISFGQTTTVTTTEDLDYSVGQLVRLIIPPQFGARQLNESQGYVLSLPSSNQAVLSINSSIGVSAFISPSVSITGAAQSNPCVLTATNSYSVGEFVQIQDVGGMIELNDNIYRVVARTPTTLTISVDSTSFIAYSSGGTASLIGTVPQILAIGDINSGQINSSGRVNNLTYINGSFINVSPQ